MSAIVHFRNEGSERTLCGLSEFPHFIEGREEARVVWRTVVELCGSGCSICLSRLDDPGERIYIPDLEFEAVCQWCEDCDDHLDTVPVAVWIDLGAPGEADTIIDMRCARCGRTDPCSESVALEAWDREQERQNQEAYEWSQGI